MSIPTPHQAQSVHVDEEPQALLLGPVLEEAGEGQDGDVVVDLDGRILLLHELEKPLAVVDLPQEGALLQELDSEGWILRLVPDIK